MPPQKNKDAQHRTALPTRTTATALEELAASLGSKVTTDDAVRAARGHDRSHLPWEPPSAVVHCTSTEDVSTALKVCSHHGVAAVPIAAGTGLEGGANSTADAICLDLSGMDNILRIGADGFDATVQAGVMKENVLGLTVVLADGTVVKTGGRARKSAAGYDLTHLFVGAEGTLGVLTEVTLHVYGIPEATGVAICSFPTVENCTAVVQPALEAGVPISRV